MSAAPPPPNYKEPLLEDLLYERDTIVLHAGVSWTPPRPFPEGWRWDRQSHSLWLTQHTFTSSAHTLLKHQFHSALFAGCVSLKASSSQKFAEAVHKVLSGCTKVTIIHNKDSIDTLLSTFSSVMELMLPHNIRVLLVDAPDAEFETPHPLRFLRGDSCGVGVNHLLMEKVAIAYVFRRCWPHLKHLDVDVDDILRDPCAGDLLLLDGENAPVWKNFILGSCRHETTLHAKVCGSIASGEVLHNVLSSSPSLNRLQLTFDNKDVLSLICFFSSIKSLCLTSVGNPCEGNADIAGAVQNFPLRVLELCHFRDVDLLTIGIFGKHLETLSLIDCTVGQHLNPGSFGKLQVLRLGFETSPTLVEENLISPHTFSSLMEQCHGLVELQLNGTVLCSAFLQKAFKKSHMVNLHKLILWVSESMNDLKVSMSDLHTLQKDLTALKHVATDSGDLRLFFEVYMPSVKLEWLSCTMCAAEFLGANKSIASQLSFFSDIIET